MAHQEPVNASIMDTLIGNQVDLVKLEGTVRKDVLAVLTDLEGDILKRLNAINPTAPSITKFQQARLEKLLAQVQGLTGGAFAKARRITDATMVQLAALETGLASGAFDVAIGTSLGIPTLNRQTLTSLVKDGLIQGAPSREWWAKQAVNTTAAFRTEMRLGVLGGESVGQLTDRVRSVMDVNKRQAEALARTSVQSVANLARLQTYQENAGLVKGIQWISTLDSRTTDICKGLDGLMWDLDFKPIGHSTTFPGPTAHWNCRSTQTPITFSFEELATVDTAASRAFARKIDGLGVTARSALDGTVPATLGYEQWLLLKEKAEPGFALNSGALTPGKYSLWKQGKLDFKQLIDQSANPINISELQNLLKDIIPATALPAAALKAQQTVVGASGAFGSKTSQAAAQAKTAQEALDARVEAAQATAAVNAKKAARDTLKSYQSKATAPTTYHFAALKDLTKQKGGKFIDDARKKDPAALVADLDKRAAKKKLSVDLAHYKQSVIKGKKPSPAAQAAFETLPDEAAKDVLDAIKIKQAEQAAVAAAEKAAAEKNAAIIAANEAAATEIAVTIQFPAGKTKLAKALNDILDDPTLKQLSPAKQLAQAKEAAAAVQAQAEKSAVLSGYKKKILSGEKPTPKQSQIVAGLSKDELDTLSAQLDTLQANLDGYMGAVGQGITPTKGQLKAANFLTPKGKKSLAEILEKEVGENFPFISDDAVKASAAGGKPAAKKAAEVVEDTAAAAVSDAVTPEILDLKQFKRVGKKPGGSVPGATYEDPSKVRWIVKEVASDEVAKNEVLTARLYQAAGVEVPEVRLIRAANGRLFVASRVIDDITELASAAEIRALPGAYEGFAADAWLADWDVVGLNFDNIVKGANGHAIRIDVGAGLRFRAQGTSKGNNFTAKAKEIETLRSPATNQQAAAVFGKIPQAKLEAGVTRILQVTDDEIDELVAAFGPALKRDRTSLAKKIKSRRDDLGDRYPHLRATKQAPAPRRVGNPVGPEEVERIENAKAAGYSIRSDIDEIEDQQILIHQEQFGKVQNTVATLKVRGKGMKKLEATVAENQSTVAGLDHTEVDNTFLTAIRGIAHRADQKVPIEAKDIERVRLAEEAMNNARDRLERLVATGVYPKTVLKKFDDHYKPWFKAIDDATTLPVSGAKKAKAVVFTAPKAKFAGVKLPKPTPKGATSEIAWERGSATFDRSTFTNGSIKKTKGKGYRGDQEMRPWETTLDDGTEIRFWDSNAPAAMRGRVEIRVTGKGELAANRAATALDEVAQIPTSLPTVLDEEELYLLQLAIARKITPTEYRKALKGKKTQIERVTAAQEFLSKKVGRDITNSVNYNPAGARGAFESGAVKRFRPDLLDDAEWERLAADFKLHHSLYGVGNADDYVKRIDEIMSSGGRLVSTTEKLRLGITPKGMSPSSDLKTGGADYAFLRIRSTRRATNSTGIVWKMRQAARTDSISYDRDHYGKTASEKFIRDHRNSTTRELRSAASGGNNETILKGGLSVFDDLEFFVVPSAKGKRDLIKLFRDKYGLSEWPDGRKLADIIKVG
jgi:SPP1 gp7 family putative phage head morphogenesis protein